MGIATGTAIALAAALAAAGTAAQVKVASDANDAAKAQADQQKKAQDQLLQQARDKQQGELAQAEADATRIAARTKQRQAAGLYGVSVAGTPGGLGSAPPSAVPTPPPGKTLLGM